MSNTAATPDITLYTAQTPNGVKISILLEELGLPYKVHRINLSENVQKEPWFLKINPNGRIPALTDGDLNLFESGSIMLYLVDKYDTDYKVSFKRGSKEYYEMTNWLFFQNAGVGPMQGQAHHFTRYAPEKIQYGIDRYANETRRLYGVLNKRLADQSSHGGYLVGDHISIADIACWGWVSVSPWAGVDIDEFPELKAWRDRLEKREGVQKGKDVPEPSKLQDLLKDPKKLEEYEKQSREWVQKGMQADAKK